MAAARERATLPLEGIVSGLAEGSLSAPLEKHDDASLDQSRLSLLRQSEGQGEGVDAGNLETVEDSSQ